MKDKITFDKIQSKNSEDLIELIAHWYFDEWGIPMEYSCKRLTNIPNKDVVFQLILFKNNNPVATGGLYKKVNLLNVYPKFKIFEPWIGLLYTTKENRNLGFGTKLLLKIEELSKEIGYNTIYLHTYSAEKLYLSNNWKSIDKAHYKEHTTIVMRKEL